MSSTNANTKVADLKTTTKKKQQPLRVIRNGAIAASIWKRQTVTGLEYLDFSLSRSWKMKNGAREGYSINFFDRNEEALVDVIQQASEFVRDYQAGKSPQDPPLAGGAASPSINVM